MLRSKIANQLFKQLYEKPIKSDCIDRVARTHNKGLKEMAGEVVSQTFVHLTNSSVRLTVYASKPPLLQALNRWGHCRTTIKKCDQPLDI